ncbi:cyclin-dependent kinase inhibitor 1-like [Punica granatum]|uniref:Uncharacterized protein n=2 Tax=Punica granatum TaxID=22663 RepID=A0A2I0J2J3_PUNGR|nr:cyclin-dependent kinase inhibitor 1-like [Punica granatum]PKI50120.1 hypothetical protein CRG98_029444 [Punica granatum]
MVRKCGGRTTEVAVIDVAAVGVRTRAQAMAPASSAAATASAKAAKRRRTIGDGNSESFKLSSNNSTCTQLRSSSGRRNSALPPPPQAPVALTEDFRCLSTSSDDQASCCSSYGSSELEKDKLRFTDLEEEHSEADSSTSSRFSRERREKTPSSVVGGGEETDSMNSSLDKLAAEPNHPQRSKEEFQSSVVDAEIEGLFGKIGKPEIIKMPTHSEIEEFFAAAEAENRRELERYKNKYNFDFVKEEPLKGRFEWHQISPAEKVTE